MADNEGLPGISIPITADYSQMQADFAAAESQAQTAGSNIASAFTSAAGSADTLDAAFQKLYADGMTVAEAMAAMQGAFATETTAADSAAASTTTFADAVKAAGLAVDPVTGAVTEFGQQTKAAGEAETQTASETASLREQFLALGEALAVTAALKEFGQMALSVASEQQNLIISLTALTGSAKAAQDQLEAIDKFSFANGLEIDKVEAATQKLIAFGFSAEQSGRLLQAAADAAAATGTSFDTVAQKVSNIALSGQAGARSLTTLGLTTADLGKQMGVTADEATKAFKALDESARVDVLTAALDKFGGTASAVAQSMSGQWQNLENDFHNVLELIGGQLIPVVTSMIGLFRDDVVPVVKAAAEGFAELPEPVKEFAIGAGLLIASLAPIAAGLAGLSLAMTGLQTIIPLVTGLMETFGLSSAAAAVQEDAAAAATTRLGTAAAETGVELEGAEVAAAGLGGALSLTLAAGVAAAVISLIDLKARLDAAHASLTAISAGDFSDWLKRATDGLKTASISTADLEAAAAKLKAGLASGAISATQYATALDAITAAEKRIEAENLAESVKGWTDGLTVLKDVSAKATDSLSLLKQSVSDAQTALDKMTVAYQSGAKSAADLMGAQNSLTSAQKAYNDALAASRPNEYLDGLKSLATQEQINAAGEDVLANKMTLLQRAALIAGQQLVDLNEQAKLLNAQVEAGTAKESDYLAKLGEVAAASDNYKAKQEALNEVKLAGETATANLTDAERNFGIQMINSGAATGDTTNAIGDYGIMVTTTTIPAQGGLTSATGNVTAALGSETSALGQVTAAALAATGAMGDLSKAAGDAAMAAGAASSLFGPTPTIKISAAQQYYNKADVPTSNNLDYEALLQASYKTNPVVPEGKTMTITEINKVMADIQSLIAKANLTDAQATAATKQAVSFYASTGALPTLAQLGINVPSGTSAASSPAGTATATTSSATSTAGSSSAETQASKAAYDVAKQAADAATLAASAADTAYQAAVAIATGPNGTADDAENANKLAQIAYVADTLAAQRTAALKALSSGTDSTSAASVTGGSTSTAASGGQYPGVVIHQAPGEVLLVSTVASSASSAASSASPTDQATLAAASSAEAASSTAAAVSTATDTITLVVGQLSALTDQIGVTAQRIAALGGVNVNTSSNTTGAISSTRPGTTGSAPAAGANVNTSSNVTGALQTVFPTGNGEGTSSDVGGTTTPPGYIAYPGGVTGYGNYQPPTAPMGGNSTGAQAQSFHVDLSGASFSSSDPRNLQTMVAQAVTQGLTRALRDAGARY